MLDGVEISNEEKVKAENLHGFDLQDREIIFKSLLPEEKFVDRRLFRVEDVQPESESDHDFDSGSIPHGKLADQPMEDAQPSSNGNS